MTRIRRKTFAFFHRYHLNKGHLFSSVNCHLIGYPTPPSLSYAWSFGSLAGVCLVIQIASGAFLSIHYTADMNLAFNSVQYIMRDVPNGWLIRYIHANGASMFFIVLYCHLFRGLYYGSYMKPRQMLWCSGVVLLLLVMGAAFTGYVLPWGQMGFWSATVITNMVTVLPGGQAIVEWVWGGCTVNSPPTLKRFYSVHFALPFIISGVTLIHLALLHRVRSSSPVGSDTGVDDIPFSPYHFVKDLFALNCFLFVFAAFVLLFPDALNHPDNYIPADPMETPKQLVPAWYFLPFYAILRSIPHKTGGILAMGGAILILFLIPFNYTGYVRNTINRPIFKWFYWFLVADFLALFYIGQAPIKDLYMVLGQYAAIYYYSFFIVIVPVVGWIENELAPEISPFYAKALRSHLSKESIYPPRIKRVARLTRIRRKTLVLLHRYCLNKGHPFRGLYCGSCMKSRRMLRFSGVCVLFLLYIGAAFIGYVLPWEQITFSDFTVLTDMVTVFSDHLAGVELVWGRLNSSDPAGSIDLGPFILFSVWLFFLRPLFVWLFFLWRRVFGSINHWFLGNVIIPPLQRLDRARLRLLSWYIKGFPRVIRPSVFLFWAHILIAFKHDWFYLYLAAFFLVGTLRRLREARESESPFLRVWVGTFRNCTFYTGVFSNCVFWILRWELYWIARMEEYISAGSPEMNLSNPCVVDLLYRCDELMGSCFSATFCHVVGVLCRLSEVAGYPIILNFIIPGL